MNLLTKVKPQYVTILESGMMLELMYRRMFLEHGVDLQKCRAEHLLGVRPILVSQFYSLLM